MKNITYTFSSVEELVAFVGKAEKCSFAIDVIWNQLVMDGKSLMGILIIGIGKQVEIICHDPEFSPESLLHPAA
ncbi:HPr family phosphocarrier protein [Clostridium sp. E02]|uniref:HPr family phosphocarrier protein n=1 Tax=Clostridium sp. E02 TaxID=2487134 RepID=UPI000F53B28F|nr:HPr family phosphocarrier protein [Clostridium sp. E02]